jgi:hypothetical protein
MAELTTEEIEALSKITVASTDNINRLKDAIGNLIALAGKLFASGEVERAEAANAAADKLKNTFVQLKNVLAAPFGNILKELGNFTDGTQNAGVGAAGLAREIYNTSNSLLQSLAPGLSEIGKGLSQNVGLMGVAAFSMVRDIISPIKEFTALTGTGGVFHGLNQSLKDVMETQNLARFNFMALGKSIEAADAEAEKFPERMRASARALGLSKEEAKKYNDAVMLIPGALNVANPALVNFGYLQDKNITISQLAQVGMKAWGLSSSESAKVQSTAYTQLNRSGESFINMLGEIHGAVTDSGVPFNIASGQILDASKSLGIFGKDAGIATNVWKSFATTLSSSGVAVDSIGTIVNQVSSSIASMSTQNRAFISMMSGMFQGATALGGSLKMELAMRSPGGLEQGLEALTGSLAKFGGGQIITLEEAAQNPQLEMQFALQRQMLGKLTGITTQEQQNRILEVMQGVQRGGISRIDGSKQLNDMMKRGMDSQANTVTAIEKLERTAGDGIRTSNSHMRNLHNDLVIMQRAGMGIRGGGVSVTPIEETPFLKTGASAATAFAGNIPGAEASRASGMEGFGSDIRRFFDSKQRERQQDLLMRAQPILKGTGLADAVRGGQGIERKSTERQLIRPDMPAATPTSALIPSRMTSEMRDQMIMDMHDKMQASYGQSVLGSGPENVRTPGTQQSGLAPEKLAAELKGVVKRSELEIIIKLDSDQPKFRKFVMDLIEKEVPNYINGQFIPRE